MFAPAPVANVQPSGRVKPASVFDALALASHTNHCNVLVPASPANVALVAVVDVPTTGEADTVGDAVAIGANCGVYEIVIDPTWAVTNVAVRPASPPVLFDPAEPPSAE